MDMFYDYYEKKAGTTASAGRIEQSAWSPGFQVRGADKHE